jgi:hypothetical protein
MMEIGILLLLIAVAIGIVLLLKSIKHFVINALVGLAILFVANLILGMNIAISWLVIAICALGGLIGAIIVILLHMVGAGF